MKSSLCVFIGFLVGSLSGAGLAYLYMKDAYDKVVREEIDSVREFYRTKEAKANSMEIKPDADPKAESYSQNDYSQYNQLLGKYTNSSDENLQDQVSKTNQNSGERPYVISPDDFGEFEDYSRISLVYYADQILADDDDELVDDIDNTVGIDSLSHFGEYEDDSVFVRNDALKCDYEILLDTRKYSEVIAMRPPSG